MAEPFFININRNGEISLTDFTRLAYELANLSDHDKWSWIMENKDLVELRGDVDQLEITFKEDEDDISVNFDECEALEKLFELI